MTEELQDWTVDRSGKPQPRSTTDMEWRIKNHRWYEVSVNAELVLYNYIYNIICYCFCLQRFDGTWRTAHRMPAVFLSQVSQLVISSHGLLGCLLTWWLRRWVAGTWLEFESTEIPICRCECNVGSSPVVTDQSLVSGNSLLILLGVIGLVIALSNTALAFKVTYRDSETGQGREFAFDVKGKSKGQLGVFGSGKGLQITNW